MLGTASGLRGELGSVKEGKLTIDNEFAQAAVKRGFVEADACGKAPCHHRAVRCVGKR